MKNIRTPTVVGLIKTEIEANKELPDISSADAGKLATVDSNGKWTAANLTVGQGEVAVDSTLLVSGAAADAMVTGDKVNELKSALKKKSIITSDVLFTKGGTFIVSENIIKRENVRIGSGATDVNVLIDEIAASSGTQYNLAFGDYETSYELSNLAFNSWYVVDYNDQNSVLQRMTYYGRPSTHIPAANTVITKIYVKFSFTAVESTLTTGSFTIYGAQIWTGQISNNTLLVEPNAEMPDSAVAWLTKGSSIIYQNNQLLKSVYFNASATSANLAETSHINVDANKQIYVNAAEIYDEVAGIGKSWRLVVREYNSSNSVIQYNYSSYGSDLSVKFKTNASTSYITVGAQCQYTSLTKGGNFPAAINNIIVRQGTIVFNGDIDDDAITNSLMNNAGSVEMTNILTKADSETSVIDGNIIFAKSGSETKTNSTTTGDVGFIVSRFSVTEGDKYYFAWDSMQDDIVADSKSHIVMVVEYQNNATKRYVYFGPEKEYITPAGVDEISILYRAYFTNKTSENVTLTYQNLMISKGSKPALNRSLIGYVDNELSHEKIKSNQAFTADGNIRKCYNPYKNAGSTVLTGQLHCHSAHMVNGVKTYYATSVEGLCALHAEHGYHFITITDYTDIGITGKPSNTHGLIWLCNSYEYSAPQDYPLFNGQHTCIYNTDTVLTDVPNNMNAQDVANLIYNTGRVCDLAHPSWTDLYQKPEKVRQIRGRIRFCEVYDRLNEIESDTTVPTGKGTDYAWEIMLDNDCVVWGTAVNDAHTGADTNGAISKGCVKVFVSESTPEAIWEALMNGCFIATTDTSVSITSISFSNGTLTINNGMEGSVTNFLGYNGEELKSVTGTTASYDFDGTEKYVRAVITTTGGDKIWTQPIILDRDMGNFGAIKQTFDIG